MVTVRCLSAIFIIATLVAATSAGAISVLGEQFSVSGRQTIVNEKAGTSKMTGGLIGNWKVTSFKEVASKPVFRGKGIESFNGHSARHLRTSRHWRHRRFRKFEGGPDDGRHAINKPPS